MRYLWIILLLGCSSPDVRILPKPVVQLPAQDRESLQRVLEGDGLARLSRREPASAIRQLHEEYEAEGGRDRLLALAELCFTQGEESEAEGSFQEAAGYYLDSARLAQPAALRASPDHHHHRLRWIYNNACGSAAYALFRAEVDWKRPVPLQGPLGSYQLALDSGVEGAIAPGFFEALVPANRLVFSDIELARQARAGVGGAMVGHRPGGEKGSNDRFVASTGYALPVNALLTFHGGRKASLALRDLLYADVVKVSGRELPLAADWTASLGFVYRYAKRDLKILGFLGMLEPLDFTTETGLHRLQRYDPDRIPVVFVHGLMSTPEIWVKVINQVRADPVLREAYQPLVYRYPTGYPIATNAAIFRERLGEFDRFYRTRDGGSKLSGMVVVCHSMGGNLTDLQIRNSGDALERLLFERPVDELNLEPKDKELLRRQLVFEANPDLKRVVFLASPHRGSRLATNPIGALGRKLIQIPDQLIHAGLSDADVAGLQSLTDAGRKEATGKLSSVRSLEPGNPLHAAIQNIPVASWVRYHSIIGQVNQDKPAAEGTDKVVDYWSSHLDGAASELIVDASHTEITRNDAAVEETIRILYLHLGRKRPVSGG